MNQKDYVELGKKKLKDIGIVEEQISEHGRDLISKIPGLGTSGEGITHKRNRTTLNRYGINSKLIGDDFVPDTSLNFFNEKLHTPVLAAPMSGISANLGGIIEEEVFLRAITEGCADAGSLGACGDSYDTTENYLGAQIMQGNKGIAVLKPRSYKDIRERCKALNVGEVTAIGFDLDGVTGMLREGRKVSRKTEEDLQKIRSLSTKPMLLKGILSLEDATSAYRSGFDGIVVSNHGGRSVDYFPGTADVLPAIAKKFKGKMKIIVDGGIKSGYDAFLYLALGADSVFVGRTILYAVIGGGRVGVKATINRLTEELAKAMLVSGCHNLQEINMNSIKLYGE